MFVTMKSKRKTLLKTKPSWIDLTLMPPLSELLPLKPMKPIDKKEQNLFLKKEEFLPLFLKIKRNIELKENYNPENGLTEFFPILMLHIKKILNGMLSLLDNKEVWSKKNELIEYICTIVVFLKTYIA